MNGAGSKIPKACEPCRRRKLKCSGEVPYCQRCGNATKCVYRLKPRIRGQSRRPAISPAEYSSVENTVPNSTRMSPTSPHSEVYHSVAATNHPPQSAHSSQLFYGPSSNFAFLQQIHRNILAAPRGLSCAPDVQECGPGLDMFMQRSLFFGTPNDTIPFTSSSPTAHPVHITEAKNFVEQFKGTYLPIMALLSPSAIDALFLCVYGELPDVSPTPRRALSFAILAIGALSTPRTDLAELLYHNAKKEAVVYEEYVSLPMVQLSILLADYQLNIGRPNAAYLHLGTACRKAFALGLHQGTVGALSGIDAQERCNTLWCLYYFEVWLSLTLGRKNTMCRSDFASYPFPEGQRVLLALCRLAIITEEAIDLLYTQRAASLHHMHATAEKLYAKLCGWGNLYGIGSETVDNHQTMTFAPMASLLLHSVYFHTILLAFRPFMIVESALSVDSTLHMSGELWLRQAYRRATDTAQDAICFFSNILRQSEECRKRRFVSFFFETCCAVLFYDSLRHPAKHSYNMEYVQMALRCLNNMVAGEPIVTAIQSVLRIQQAVEWSISGSEINTSVHGSPSNDLTPLRSMDRVLPSIQFPSLDRTVDRSATDLILFTDRNRTFESTHDPGNMGLESGADPSTDSFWLSNFNVLTTDLFNFFPTYTA